MANQLGMVGTDNGGDIFVLHSQMIRVYGSQPLLGPLHYLVEIWNHHLSILWCLLMSESCPAKLKYGFGSNNIVSVIQFPSGSVYDTKSRVCYLLHCMSFTIIARTGHDIKHTVHLHYCHDSLFDIACSTQQYND